MRTNGRIDRHDEANFRVRNFEKAPKWDEQDYSNTFSAIKYGLLTF